MKRLLVKCFFLALAMVMIGNVSSAQTKKRTSTKRSSTKRSTTKKTTNSKTKTTVNPSNKTVADTVAKVVKIDSLPGMGDIRKSLRKDEGIDRVIDTGRRPLTYQRIREDDAVYRERLWREIDIREKMNLPFRYSADGDKGNQRFISILFKAIQNGPDNGGVTAFAGIDDRFTTPMTISEVAQKVSGGVVSVPQYDSLGNITGSIDKVQEVNLDSFYKFHIKEDVIFDKQTSRLYWRILGIAVVKNIITAAGINIGETELFWVYYPDMRPILANYEVYNPKNFGQRMTWEELFESRFFSGRIIKSTLDNPYDRYLKEYPGIKDNSLLQLYEGENIKDKIFNYEQNLWSY